MKVDQILNEAGAADYKAMFQGLIDRYPELYIIPKRSVDTEKIVDRRIDSAVNIFKRYDRIMWRLRIDKMYIFKRYFDTTNDSWIEKQKNKLISKYPYVLEDYEPRYDRSFEHFLNLPIREIENFQFHDQTPEEILSYFSQLEEEWMASRDYDKERVVRILDDHKVFIDFNDGFAWWIIGRNGDISNQEKNAMKHCGAASGSNNFMTLSLREEIHDDLVVPHVTSAVDENSGYIVETKGFNNKKPDERFYEYLEELLMDNRIEGLDNSNSYMPEEDFNVTDLPNWESLIEEKPTLITMSEKVSALGANHETVREDFVNYLEETFIKHGLYIPFLSSEVFSSSFNDSDIFDFDDNYKFNEILGYLIDDYDDNGEIIDYLTRNIDGDFDLDNIDGESALKLAEKYDKDTYENIKKKGSIYSTYYNKGMARLLEKINSDIIIGKEIPLKFIGPVVINFEDTIIKNDNNEFTIELDNFIDEICDYFDKGQRIKTVKSFISALNSHDYEIGQQYDADLGLIKNVEYSDIQEDYPEYLSMGLGKHEFKEFILTLILVL